MPADKPTGGPVPEPPSQSRWLSWKTLLALWLVLIVVQIVLATGGGGNQISYTEFKQRVEAGEVERVRVGEHVVRGELVESVEGPREFRTNRVEDEGLLGQLTARGVEVAGDPPDDGGLWRVLGWILPLLLMLLLFGWLMRRMSGAGGGGAFGLSSVGRSKARVYIEKEVGVVFDDVAGVDEAKEELREVIEFLRTPERFQRLGGKLPKGILLVGPPGTGKTLLARAVAGEAGVPFFSISGSEFVEMFVGVGASRVRDLFTEAKKRAPCIIFIDELDAVGKARGLGPQSHEEREQTLNQLLVEIDGFDATEGVVLMAATNRPEILDKALLRAGRFDRHVLVDRPDRGGRRAILAVHARKVRLAGDVDLDDIAAMTAGFAGADLANIINESALLAVRRGHEAVTPADLREAVERVIAGLEKKNRVLLPREKERVAHHEIGHALMSLALPGTDPVQKISIIPRGISALGYTLQLPTEDRFLMTRSELENRICMLLGGRVAEEVIYGDVSTGAQDDLRKATDIARSMVELYGMSDRIGSVSLQRGEESLLGQGQTGRGEPLSEHMARQVDEEVRRIIGEQYARTRNILAAAEPTLRRAAGRLIEKETLSGQALKELAGNAFAAGPDAPHPRRAAAE